MANKFAINKRIKSIIQAKAIQARSPTPLMVHVLRPMTVANATFPIAWV